MMEREERSGMMEREAETDREAVLAMAAREALGPRQAIDAGRSATHSPHVRPKQPFLIKRRRRGGKSASQSRMHTSGRRRGGGRGRRGCPTPSCQAAPSPWKAPHSFPEFRLCPAYPGSQRAPAHPAGRFARQGPSRQAALITSKKHEVLAIRIESKAIQKTRRGGRHLASLAAL